MEKHLNNLAKKYLKMIKEDYHQYMSEHQKQYLEKLLLLDNIVKVEETDTSYINNQLAAIDSDKLITPEFKKIAKSKINTPIAHGGRVFEDDIIHFYPFTVKGTEEEKLKECEDVLAHELFHYFIRPQYIPITNKGLSGINTYISEGLVDMCARAFLHHHNLHPEYKSDYSENVMFVNDVMESIPVEERIELAFKNNIEDIIKDKRFKLVAESKKIIDEFKLLIKDLVELCTTDHLYGRWYSMMNISASFPNITYTLNYVRGFLNASCPEKMEEINTKINDFKKEIGLTTQQNPTFK